MPWIPQVLALGEAMVEFNQSKRAAPKYLQGFSGDVSNFLIAAARQGAATDFVSAVGNDHFGPLLLDLWRAENVDTSTVRVDQDAPTGVYFVSHGENRHRFDYLRAGSAASRYAPSHLLLDAIASAKVVYLSGINLAIGVSACDAALAAIDYAGKHGVKVSFDTNLRLKLWPLARARAVMTETIRACDIYLPSWDDVTLLTGHEDKDAIVDALLNLGPKVVALKLGRKGAFIARIVAGDDLFAAVLSTQGFGAVAQIPDRAAVECALAKWAAGRPESARAALVEHNRTNTQPAETRYAARSGGSERRAHGGRRFRRCVERLHADRPGRARGVRGAVACEHAGGDEVGHVVFGNVIQTEPRDMYLARVAALDGGVSQHAPALTVNRLCGSGLQAIVSASQSILLGDADIAIGGGAENMTRTPYIMPAVRFGQRMGDTRIVDMMIGALNDPFDKVHMGVTAENVTAKFGITREMQDALALESHPREAKALEAGYFRDQILPVTIALKKGDTVFEQDEHVRLNATAEDFAKLKPVFAKENGTVTAGNASGINDAAAAVVLMERGAKPLARLVAYAPAGVDPKIMGIGPASVTQKVLERTGLSVDDLDVIEANEAFAAQACAVTKELKLDPARVNLNGSAFRWGIRSARPAG